MSGLLVPMTPGSGQPEPCHDGLGEDAAPDGGFGIYVHWPFCQSKCPYCDFNSHVRHQGVDEARFARALAAEIATMAQRTAARWPASVFFGGGTPSLMSPATVEEVLCAIDQAFGLGADTEVSLEANPSSVEQKKFEGFRAAGVNRVSLGVQSLRDADLVALGRRHDSQTARAALALARRTFERVSADLIYARPGQIVADWQDELDEMLGLCGDHLSLYQLTIEPQTIFFDLHLAGKLKIPDDDLAADLFDATDEATRRAGFVRYEVSNHALPGAECRHNLVYWRGGQYVGVGPGAHGRIAENDVRIATETVRHPETWCESVERRGHGIAAEERLTCEDQLAEALVMGLRLAEGVPVARVEARAGRPLDPLQIATLCEQGLLSEAGGRITVPERARLLTNSVVRELLP